MNIAKSLLLFIIVFIPISHYFIIPGVIKSTEFKQNLVLPVRYEAQLVDESKKFQLYRKSSKGNIVNLDNERYPSARRFIRGISVKAKDLDSIKYLDLFIGKKQFSYTKEKIKESWKTEIKGNEVFHLAPDEADSESVLKTMFFFSKALSSVVNWSPHLFLNIIYLLVVIGFISFLIKFHRGFIRLSLELGKAASFNKKQYLILGIFFSIVSCISFYFSRMEIDTHHVGFVFQAAQKLSEGKQLFSEVFYHYAPLTAHLHNLSIFVFGEEVLSLNLLSSLFYGGIAVLFYFLLSHFFALKTSVLLAILWFLFAPFFKDTFIPWSSIYCLFFLLSSILFSFKYFETSKTSFLILSGVTAAFCFWTRQSVGPLVFIGYIISFSFIHFIEGKSLKSFLKNISLLFFRFINNFPSYFALD
ncbi:MAG: hypothetical protein CME70_21260 [Halobacteriovorax sp.]|nr:hypothetical protein [Halobacteriovorax sp.]|tara:strand:+ start:108852 stop:110099 length:1248 start_codon:yes stop_codon:yes gene_type:complete